MPYNTASSFLARARAPIAVFAATAAGPASAHVKWFSRDADYAMAPLSPLQVISSLRPRKQPTKNCLRRKPRPRQRIEADLHQR